MSMHPMFRFGAVGLVRNDSNSVLLCRARQRGWSLPGGFIEHGETPRLAVEREVLEETGIRCLAGDLLGTFISIDQNICTLLFSAKSVEKAKPFADGIETTQAGWFTIKEARGIIESPAHRLFLDKGLDTMSGALYCWYEQPEHSIRVTEASPMTNWGHDS